MKTFCGLFAVLSVTCLPAIAVDEPITLLVDATDATRNILHARLHIPAHPGPLTLVYPKWIPGEHGPTGPINDVTGLKISAAGHDLEWQRDPEDMFAFHFDVPPAVTEVDVALDFLLSSTSGSFSAGGSSTAQLLDLNWNQVLLYPQGAKPHDLQFRPSLLLPEGWKFGTALTTNGHNDRHPQFNPVSLETLVDSPVIMGAYYKSIDLSPKNNPPHFLDMVADSEEALDVKPAIIRDYMHLVTETGALFGARHYRSYSFLLTLSDHVAHFGLEHHESSDNREGEKYLTDDDELLRGAYLLCHEMVHSWNGKYRRPAGLATPDYQTPMRGELLWVYEGLTDYLGAVLAARSGLWTNATFREYLALEAGVFDHEPGRDWRPLADTTEAAQLLYEAPSEGMSRRRGTDFYGEGDLIWLEADTIIRQETKGARSLDDFCKLFHGGKSGPPEVIPYNKESVFAALNQIAPFDWAGFFQKRVYQTNLHAPLGGIERGGWKLVYTNEVPGFQKARESGRKYTDMRFSLGFVVREDGSIQDVIPNSPADVAGLGTGMKLVAVNNRKWTPGILRTAVKEAARTKTRTDLLVENADYYRTLNLNYHGGEKYPALERDSSKPDLLDAILKPLTPEPK